MVYRGFRMLVISLCGGMITAFGTMIYVMNGGIHFFDLFNLSAYEGAAIFGSIGGLIMFPLTYFCLRDRQIFPAVLWLYLFSAVGSLIVTVLSVPPGLLWNFVIAAVGLLICRWQAKPLSVQKSL